MPGEVPSSASSLSATPSIPPPAISSGEPTSNIPTMNIHILGAGLSGLVLARCLQRANVRAAVTLWERDAAEVLPKRHGYAIMLRPETWKKLVPILGGGEKEFWERVGVLRGDEREGRVNRRKLEDELRKGLEVRCAHELKEVAVESGKVRLGFEKGAEVVDVGQGGIVVGADGAHSPLRRALLPEVELGVLPFVVFNGKRRIERKRFEESCRPSFTEGTTVIQRNMAGGAVFLRLSIDEVEDERVSVSYTYSRPAKKEQADDALYKPNRPNAGAKDIPNELFEELHHLEPELDGALKEVFSADAVRKDRLLHWLMRSLLVPRKELVKQAESGVLFLGDAIHHAPILGSEGANEAILDAMELASFLTEHRGPKEWYGETRYTERWSRHVHDGIKRLDKLHRPNRAKV